MRSVSSLEDIDPEVVELCDALNSIPGVHTEESCSGHGMRPLYVYFRVDQAGALESVMRHMEGPGWRLWESIDRPSGRHYFKLQGPVGERAFYDSKRRARNILADESTRVM